MQTPARRAAASGAPRRRVLSLAVHAANACAPRAQAPQPATIGAGATANAGAGGAALVAAGAPGSVPAGSHASPHAAPAASPAAAASGRGSGSSESLARYAFSTHCGRSALQCGSGGAPTLTLAATTSSRQADARASASVGASGELAGCCGTCWCATCRAAGAGRQRSGGKQAAAAWQSCGGKCAPGRRISS